MGATSVARARPEKDAVQSEGPLTKSVPATEVLPVFDVNIVLLTLVTHAHIALR